MNKCKVLAAIGLLAMLPMLAHAEGMVPDSRGNGKGALRDRANTWTALQTFSGGFSAVAGGDLSGNYPNPTVANVNGVAYPATPSTNTVPVVTGSNTVTYEAVPNAALANSSMTFGSQSVSLGGTAVTQGTGDKIQLATGTTTTGDGVKFDASGNLIDTGAAAASGTVNTGTAGQVAYYGASAAAVSGNPDLTISTGALTVGLAGTAAGSVALSGVTSGTLTLAGPSVAGSNTITFPAGTTDFTSTGGTSEVVRQSAAGGALTVSQLACSDLSNASPSCSTDATNASNITTGNLPFAQNTKFIQAMAVATGMSTFGGL